MTTPADSLAMNSLSLGEPQFALCELERVWSRYPESVPECYHVDSALLHEWPLRPSHAESSGG